MALITVGTRLRMYFLAFFTYVAFAACRKTQSNVKSFLQDDGVPSQIIGALDTVFLFSYALGQLVWGQIGDRFSYRYVLFYGTSVSALSALFFALAAPNYFNVLVHSAYLLVFWGVFGFSSAAGLPIVNALLNKWFPSKYRGVVFGSFGVSPQLGYLLCNGIAALMFGQGVYWPILVFAGACFLFVMGILDLFFVPKAKTVLPDRVQVVALDSDLKVTSGAAPASRSDGRSAITLLGALRQPDVAFYAISYFFGRMTTYSTLAWLPFFFKTQLLYPASTASLIAMSYDGACIVGSFCTSAIASSLDTRRGAGRPTVYASLYILAPAALAVFVSVLLPGNVGSVVQQPSIGATVGVTILIGFFVPVIDSLVIGSITADLGMKIKEKRGMATVAGVVNSFGNFGAGIACILVPIIAQWGWAVVFYVLMCASGMALLFMIPPAYKDFVKVLAGRSIAREDSLPLLGGKSGDGNKLQVQIMLDPINTGTQTVGKGKTKRPKVIGLDDDSGWDTDNGFEKYVVKKKAGFVQDSSDDQSFSDGEDTPFTPKVIKIDEEIKIVNVGAIDTRVRVKPGQKISSTGKIVPVIDNEPDTEPSSDEEGDIVKRKASSPASADPTAYEDSYVRAKTSGDAGNQSFGTAASFATSKRNTSMMERRKTKLGLVRPAELQVATPETTGRGRSATLVASPSVSLLRATIQPAPVPLSELKKKKSNAKAKKLKRRPSKVSPLDLVDSEDDDPDFDSDNDSDLEWSDIGAMNAARKMTQPLLATSSSFSLRTPPMRSGSSVAMRTAPSAPALKSDAPVRSQSDIKVVRIATKQKGKAKESESSSVETEPSSSSSSSSSSSDSE